MPNTQGSDTNLGKGAIFPALLIATLACVGVSVVKGMSGLLAGLLASLTVFIFFSVHLLVAKISRDLDPTLTMMLAMLSYFAKVFLMGAFLLLVTKFTDRSTVDRASFAICAILITMTWLISEIRSFLRLRLHLPLPKKEGQN